LLPRPVAALRLEEDDRILVADRRDEQREGVGRRRRRDDLQSRQMRVEGLHALRVQLGPADPAVARDPDRQRQVVLAARTGPEARDLRRDLVERRVAETVELELDHWPPTRDAEPDREADDPRLCARRVEDAARA